MQTLALKRLWKLFHSLSCFALAIAAGCSKPDPAMDDPAAVNKPKSLRISQGGDLLTFDPYYYLESPTFCVQVNVFDPLTDIDPDMKIVPALAESWKNLEPTVWEFKLRPDVKFHDGQPFDAEDVKYSLKRAIEWPSSKVRSEIPTVKNVEVVDALTVKIETTAPDAILPTRLASVLIMDKESTAAAIEKEGDPYLANHPNGTGPYKLGEWKKDLYCRLVANETHWRGAPSIKEMVFLSISNPMTRMASFQSGEIDIMMGVPVQDVDRVKTVKGYHVVNQPSLRLIYLGLDCSRDASPGVPGSPPNPLKDLRVRQAIYQAINIDLLIRTVMSGQALPANQLSPEPIFGFDPSIKRPPYDPEKAKALLSEAGFPNGFRVRLDSPNDRYVNDAKLAAAIAQQLALVGITVDVNSVPKTRFFTDERNGKCSFFLIGWANTNGDGNGTFDHLLHTFDTTKNLGDSNTSTLYSNPELDRLTQISSMEFDPAKRLDLLQQATRIAMHDLPHIPLHFQMDIYAVSDKLDWTPRRDTQVRGIDVKWK